MRLRELSEAELPQIHGLLAEALVRDRFSQELIREKLFQPGPDRSVVFGAQDSDGALVGVMQAVVRPGSRRAYLGLFATRQQAQRGGVAAALYGQAQAVWAAAGATEVEALAIPGNYFWPGLDPLYTPALCFLEGRGFVRFSDCVNLRCDLLAQDFDTAPEEAALLQRGLVVRRATAADEALLLAFFEAQFGALWRREAQQALGADGLHLALRDGRIVSFSAHSGMNREWGFFGPMGTAKEAEGLGLGRVLLRRCLADLKRAGHLRAVIPWVGPIRFYARHAGCEVERVFWRYKKSLTA